jgi:hypothetical protein
MCASISCNVSASGSTYQPVHAVHSVPGGAGWSVWSQRTRVVRVKWCLWKHPSECVLSGASPMLRVEYLVLDEARVWAIAGAKGLCRLLP